MDWNLVEKNMRLEMDFLRKYIDPSPFSHNDPIKCPDCLFRLITSLLISGKIKIKLIKYDENIFWNKKNTVIEKDGSKNHGADWHSSKIKLIKKYFENNKYIVEDESQMFFGRCDLSVKALKVFVEVGTINIYKLYLNLSNMKDGKILLVTNDNYALEFTF